MFQATFVHQGTASLSPFLFKWQEGFGAFSHSRSELDNVVKYIST
jgi:hypothetical protein